MLSPQEQFTLFSERPLFLGKSKAVATNLEDSSLILEVEPIDTLEVDSQEILNPPIPIPVHEAPRKDDMMSNDTLLGFDEIRDQALEDAGEISEGARLLLIEDLRLRFQFPDEHVAYIDTWKIVGKKRQLMRRVLAHSPDVWGIKDAIDSCTEAEWRNTTVTFLDSLDDDLEVPDDVGER